MATLLDLSMPTRQTTTDANALLQNEVLLHCFGMCFEDVHTAVETDFGQTEFGQNYGFRCLKLIVWILKIVFVL